MRGERELMKRIGILTIVVMMFALATSALAAPKPGGYLGSAGNVQNAVGPAATPAGGVVGQASGTLPFTGTDLVVFTAVGLLLVGAGLSMRRVSRRRSN